MFGNLPLYAAVPSLAWGYVGGIPVELGEQVPASTAAVMGQRAFKNAAGELVEWKFPVFERFEEAVAFAVSKGFVPKVGANAVRYADGVVRELKRGDRIRANGYEGSFWQHYSGQMIEVRLPGGVCCMDASGVEIVPPKPLGVPGASEHAKKMREAAAAFEAEFGNLGKLA